VSQRLRPLGFVVPRAVNARSALGRCRRFLILGSVLLPQTEVAVLEAVRGNHYTAALLPLLFGVGVMFVIPNWVFMKLFRHN